jgi:uncharacterized protein YkwD
MPRLIGFLSCILIIYLAALTIFLPRSLENSAKAAYLKTFQKTAYAQESAVLGLKTSSQTSFYIPTNTPTPSPVKPTSTPAPAKPTLVKSESNQTVSAASDSAPIGNAEEYIMNAINDYRKSQGLPGVSPNRETCDFAKKRAQELASNFSHDGFRPYPYASFSKVTENIAMNSDYTKVISNWIASSGHAANMREDTPYVCVSKNGNYYAYEGWKP